MVAGKCGGPPEGKKRPPQDDNIASTQWLRPETSGPLDGRGARHHMVLAALNENPTSRAYTAREMGHPSWLRAEVRRRFSEAGSPLLRSFAPAGQVLFLLGRELVNLDAH